MVTAGTTTTATAISRAFNFWSDQVQVPPTQDDSSPTIFLQPRRFARLAGLFTLVPLLPRRPPVKVLPAEVWRRVLLLLICEDGHVGDDKSRAVNDTTESVWSLVLISKSFKVRLFLVLVGNQIVETCCNFGVLSYMRTVLAINQDHISYSFFTMCWLTTFLPS